MLRTGSQKPKLTAYLKTLTKRTDERHPDTMADILSCLKSEGIPGNRTSVTQDIAYLIEVGTDVACNKSNPNTYFIEDGHFELPELKLLINAIQASFFILHKKAGALIDKLAKLTSVMDKNGFKTHYIYDGNGNVVKTQDALGNCAFFEYDSMDRLVKVKLNRVDYQDFVNTWEITLYEYDHRGLTTKEIGATGLETTYSYDGNGNLIQKNDADGYITLYGYDARDLVNAINYSDSQYVAFGYNGNGELVEMTDWNGITSFGLDLLGRITSVNDHNEETVSYTYDAVGNQTAITYPDGTANTYEYDLLGRMTKMTDPEAKDTSYVYDAASQLISQIYPNGWKEYYEYDAAGQQTRVLDINPRGWLTKAVAMEYWYDAEGNVVKEFKRGVGGQKLEEYTYCYDPLDRLTLTTGKYWFGATSYQYDSLGNLTLESTAGKLTDYKYNDLNEQTSKTVNYYDVTCYGYDNRGNLTKASKPIASMWGAYEQVTEEYIYDATNRLSVGVNSKGETSAYIYNGLGYRIGNIQTTLKDCYGYYGFGASPVNPWYPGWGYGFTGYGAWGYGYPGFGYGAGYGLGYGYGAYPAYGYGYPSYGYDWGAGINTGDAEAPAEPEWPFEGIVKPFYTQTVEKTFVLDYTSLDKDVILEKENGGLTFKFNYGLEKVSALISGPTYGFCNLYVDGKAKVYFHEDRLGSTEYISDDFGGNVLSYIDYDAWGVPTNKATVMLGLRAVDLVAEYTGHPYDAVLGMYFAEARMYDAADRRFVAVDPVKGGVANTATLVQYTYVLDNPLKWVDPWGLDAILINKHIDIGNGFAGIEHMSMLIEGDEGKWYYYFWGDVVRFIEVVPDAMVNMDALNDWLLETVVNEKSLLEKPNIKYITSVYVKGDFSDSLKMAENDLKLYKDENRESQKDLKGLPNQYYNVFTNNCSQKTMEMFFKGVLPDGTLVKTYAGRHRQSYGVSPDVNMNNMQQIFYNKAFTLVDFDKAIDAQREKYEGKNEFTQWWYSVLKSDIEAISPKQ